MAHEFPDSDEELDFISREEYEVLKNLEGKSLEKRQLSQPDPSGILLSDPNGISQPGHSGISQAINKSQQETSIEIVTPIDSNFDNNTPDSNRKRGYEELLGDISDLLQEDILDEIEEPKEKKLRWDQPEDIIKKILETRQLLHEHVDDTSRKTQYNDDKKSSISLRIPPWNFVAITRTYDSQRLYVRVRNIRSNVKRSSGPIVNLLSTSYAQLKVQAGEIMAKRNKLSAQPTSDLHNTEKIINDELWVDKYRPQSYLELLSDETVNREFLHWLKLWDKIVFNRNINTSKKSKLPMFGKKKDIDDDSIVEVDSKGYPVKRIALLSGPPGLGKTTLAHIVARHAGYNIVEINASDDRSPNTFKQILLASTEMKAVMGANPRPNCLIFDEIDGAPAASIELLLKFVQGKLISKAKKGKNQTEKSDGCARPVVCICNEPYTPTLRTLRAAALIISVPEVTPLRLAERLMDIARKENLNVDFGDLLKIAERSGCDVRSCVGALQYMGSANLKDNSCLGLKDTRKNLFDSWRSILTIPMHKGGVVTISERLQNILTTVQNGETEKLAQGIFHNYPETCDKKLDSVSTSLEWFQFYDLITSFVAHKQIWSLMPYINYGFIAWHLYLARTQKVKLSYPIIFGEVTQKSTKNMDILTAIRKVCGRDTFTLTTDIAGFLPDLLAAKLRTVPSHLYSSQEKGDLIRIVNVMLEFGLSFVQEKNHHGGYIYNIDPNILEIGIFPNCNTHRCLAYAVQQIITQELEVERLKRASISMGLDRSSKDVTIPQNTETAENIQNESTDDLRNSAKQTKKNVAPPKEIVYRDFFGNIITSESNRQRQNKATNRISPRSQKGSSAIQNMLTKYGIWYKYKEGCNNAVRRNVFIEKLL